MKSLTWSLAAALVMAFAGVAWAGPPTELATDPPSNDPIPRCIVDSGSAQGDQLSILRTGCDVLSFTEGFKHGHIRPCNDAQDDCSADGNGNACDVGDRLWLCLAN